MRLTIHSIPTALGPMHAAVDPDGAVHALQFEGGWRRRSLELSLIEAGYQVSTSTEPHTDLQAQLAEYFAGQRLEFTLSIVQRGSAVETEVRRIIGAIPYGQTKTYGQIAAELGNPGRAYEVGQICAGNPLLLLIPCHRVVAADGSLRGYAGGLHRKQQLLSLEQRIPIQGQLTFATAD